MQYTLRIGSSHFRVLLDVWTFLDSLRIFLEPSSLCPPNWLLKDARSSEHLPQSQYSSASSGNFLLFSCPLVRVFKESNAIISEPQRETARLRTWLLIVHVTEV